MDVEAREYEDRIARLRSWMEERRIDVVMLGPGSNMRYLSGTENAGLLVVPAEGDPFLTAQYAFGDELARRESFLEVVVVRPRYGTSPKDVVKPNLVAEAAKRLREAGLRIRRVAVERDKGQDHLSKIRKGLRRGGRRPTLVDVGRAMRDLRAVKSEAEVELIRRSSEIAIEAFERTVADLKEGQTEAHVANRLEFEMRELGAEGPSFPSIVAFGEHTFNAHHVPTQKRLEKGQLVLFDFGARYKGYCSDMTRTFVFGEEPRGKVRERLEAVFKAQEAGKRAAREGVPLMEPDVAARRVLEGYGDLLDYFVHSLGHGVGLDIHEYPRLIVGADGTLRAGMVVTVEPGIYIKGWGGVRFEDTVVVRREGVEVLTDRLTRELRLG
ncbi:MAG: Xaa-Pro peptidase family protein [Candidatus Korarchaeota archaeon]|nr:Xaa-Pro peptidase family protein [Candidatus Korarchaeota archaeon]